MYIVIFLQYVFAWYIQTVILNRLTFPATQKPLTNHVVNFRFNSGHDILALRAKLIGSWKMLVINSIFLSLYLAFLFTKLFWAKKTLKLSDISFLATKCHTIFRKFSYSIFKMKCFLFQRFAAFLSNHIFNDIFISKSHFNRHFIEKIRLKIDLQRSSVQKVRPMGRNLVWIELRCTLLFTVYLRTEIYHTQNR